MQLSALALCCLEDFFQISVQRQAANAAAGFLAVRIRVSSQRQSGRASAREAKSHVARLAPCSGCNVARSTSAGCVGHSHCIRCSRCFCTSRCVELGQSRFFDFPRFNQQVKPALPTLAQLPGTFCWQWLRSSYTDSLCRKPEAATFRSTGFAFAYARPPVRKLETVPGSVLHL